MSREELERKSHQPTPLREPLMRALTEPMQRRATPQRMTLGLRVLLWMLQGLRVGTLEVQLPGGARRIYEGGEAGPRGVLQIRDPAMISQVLKNGEVGFGEAYMDGRWESPDLASLLAVMYLNEPHYKGPYERMPFMRLYGWLQHRRRANTKHRAKENIQYHYDLGNDFYRLWLDDSMAYSSAVFASPNDTLHQAQLNKFENLYQRLDLKPEHHLLEIGSGWGGFAVYCAQRSGCRVTGITLSQEQLVEASARAEREGVAERVKFELRDYRDVSEHYDRIASIEMYEAVGEQFWPTYFETIHRVLKPGGIASIQGITISDKIFDQYRNKRDFIQKYIFPGGMLSPPEHFQKLAAAAGLRPEDPQLFALDYAETLAHWHRSVQAVREPIKRQFGERFYRMWRYYLAYCECGFRVGSLDLMQISLRKL